MSAVILTLAHYRTRTTSAGSKGQRVFRQGPEGNGEHVA